MKSGFTALIASSSRTADIEQILISGGGQCLQTANGLSFRRPAGRDHICHQSLG